MPARKGTGGGTGTQPASPSPIASTLRVSVELGGTFPTGDYGNLKPLIRLDGLDPGGDVAAQIQAGLASAGQIFVAINEELERQLSDAMTPGSKPGISARIDRLELWSKDTVLKMADEIRRQKTLVDEMAVIIKGRPQVVNSGAIRAAAKAENLDPASAADGAIEMLAERTRAMHV